MRIGEVAKRTGFSTDTLRWYEKIGLIQLDKNTRSENNYRFYDEHTLKRLLDIRNLKYFGFTLKEIQELFCLEELDELSCPHVAGILSPKLDRIDQQIEKLQQIRARLHHIRESCTGNCKEALQIPHP